MHLRDAVRAMLDEAYADPTVEAVIAHTLPEHNPSTRVLERAGFAFDREHGGEWRWSHKQGAARAPGPP